MGSPIPFMGREPIALHLAIGALVWVGVPVGFGFAWRRRRDGEGMRRGNGDHEEP